MSKSTYTQDLSIMRQKHFSMHEIWKQTDMIMMIYFLQVFYGAQDIFYNNKGCLLIYDNWEAGVFLL